ncbi:VacJ family lipoprotein [Rodentibacter caecimuris]|uniref:ABC transporter n=1 Tax=Rodentibacter caecimuris TaxID=1796644 RepID=A0ABX3KZV7_9PAST|nr:hypothetical protein BKG89_00160 [Rodentibacter heylii]
MKKATFAIVLLGALMLTGCATKTNGERNDPIEGFNRAMWKFNYDYADKYVVEPVAKGWRDYVPSPIRTGLVNVANNLDEPVSFVNRLIEGEPRKAFVHFNRFWINTVFGLGGLIDFASASEPLRIDNERNFGETLGSYGVDAGAYIMLPIYGATTLRQGAGDLVDIAYMSPFWNAVGGPWSLVKWSIQGIDSRANNLDNAELLRQAQDSYVTFREAYYQNLEFKVKDGKATEQPQSELSDDVLKEID